MISAIIIIDTWDYQRLNCLPGTENYQRLSKIKKFIDDNTDIKTVILASYNCKKSEILSDQIWYKNSKSFLGEELWNKKLGYCLNSDLGQETNLILQKWKLDRFQIAMHCEWEFEKFFNKNLSRIYMAGQAWDECVANRPLGYKSLYNITKDWGTEILVKNDHVKNMDGSYFDPMKNKDWSLTESSDIYRYTPELTSDSETSD